MPLPPYLHRLTLPTPFSVGPVNVYLAEGQPLTLIDTGPLADVTRAALEAALAERRYRVEDLQQIILTHHHVDHIGLAAEIVRRSGAVVVTHPHNLPWLADYGAQDLRQRPFYYRLWEEHGVPADIVAGIARASDGIARWTQPVAAAGSLTEGTRLPLGTDDWQVFHTPGHAGGLICLWEPRTRTLLANDHFLRDISSNPIVEPPPSPDQPRPHRLVEYLHHMARMAALEPAVALPGHGEPVSDVAGLLRQRQAFHTRRARRLRDTLADRALTLWELTQPLFPRLTRGMDFFLALSEVLGHLDLLAESGQVQLSPDGHLYRWAKTDAPPASPLYHPV